MKKDNGTPLKGEDYAKINMDEWTDFRLSGGYDRTSASTTTKTTSTAGAYTMPTPTRTPASYELDAFNKGIKRDPSAFPTLKDKHYQDSWHKRFLNQLEAQGLADIANPTFSPDPNDASAITLFHCKNTFVCTVLYDKVLTTKGKELLAEHYDDKDGQKVYEKLLLHHTKSTSAGITAREIQSYLTNTKLGDGKFKGTAEAFIGHFIKQFDLHDDLTGTHMGNATRMMHLVEGWDTFHSSLQVHHPGGISHVGASEIIMQVKLFDKVTNEGFSSSLELAITKLGVGEVALNFTGSDPSRGGLGMVQ